MALKLAEQDAKSVNEIIGSRIRKARTDREWTQADLAERAAKNMGSPVSRQAVAQWERAVSSPSYSALIALAATLEVSPAYLAFGIEGGTTVVNLTPATVRPLVHIPQVDYGDSLDDRKVTETWGIPDTAFGRLGAPKSQIEIMAIRGNSVDDDYRSGELVYVNKGDKRPDGGVVAYWDGMGVGFAYATVQPSKNGPKLRLQNKAMSLEIGIEDATIIGKVCGRMILGQ